MPSFVTDENSPVYPSHAGVIHIGDASQSQQHYPVKAFPPTQHPSAVSFDRHQGPEELRQSFDDFDNSSSHSSDTSDPRARMNGDVGLDSSMTPLPNGGRTANGHVNGTGMSNQGMGNSSFDSKPSLNAQNARKLPIGDRISTDSRPMMNGRTSTSSSTPTIHALPPSQHQYQRNSVESSGRPSMQQIPAETTSSRSLYNGERTPRASHDTASYSIQNSGSPSFNATTPEPFQQKVPSPTPHRFSSPPHYQSPSAPPSASASTLQAPPNQLKHRHTLEVPKVNQGRGSKDGASDAAFATGRYSPTVAGPTARRASLSLVRRNTRSVHSDMPRDEIQYDEDTLRWTEAMRQKRARKKQREEFEHDDRVLVGTKVDENHANFTTAYNMLTGIRVSVSRTNAKVDRPLTEADFDAKQKSTFDITGNELVPSAKYDFKFKDYAPWVFRHLRALFRLDPADYLMSLTGKYILSELGSPGKSGSFFYFSRDYKYIIKTIHHGEHKFLRKILKDYYNHVTDNPNTLLSQFYGLHRVKMPYTGKKIHFVVMNNLFPPHRDIHQTFDLKGSTVGRDYREEDLEKNPRATLKDLNWLRRKRHLELGLQKKQMFLQQLQKDVRLMQRLQIMDYSLLIGVHDLQKGNEENLRGKTLQVFNPGGDATDDDHERSRVLMRTPSKLESARKARELRQMIRAERPVPLDQSSDPMPEELEEGYGRAGIFYNDDGGIRATHDDNTPGQEIYYLGVIDCLTHYGMIKKIEHFWKGLSHDRTQISALPPHEYGERFIKFMAGVTMSPEEAERDEMNRQAAAEAAAISNPGQTSRRSSQRRNSASAPPAPTYLPPPPPPLRSPGSPEVNSTVEKAMKKAFKKEQDVSSEDDIPDRLMTTVTSPGGVSGKNNSHAVLPVVEETVEAMSVSGVSGRSRGDSSSEHRPFTPSPIDSSGTMRSNGFTDLGPHGIGGRGPPTPPKSSYLDPEARFGMNGNRGGSGNGYSGEKSLRRVISRDSLDKALPPLPRDN
ncbi:hypothetical protein BX600DRAFT_435139 [Xylariales sp. PMI_506]|nr:hypothetical protein BX600DRAFT_435139 [Xylariales sp. PMI_506]